MPLQLLEILVFSNWQSLNHVIGVSIIVSSHFLHLVKNCNIAVTIVFGGVSHKTLTLELYAVLELLVIE
jgi:hypothetical protein